MLGYAVVDLETTGLHPGRHDRVVEIAIMSLTCDGEITGEWSSLVNPHRDVGPTQIHRIRACDVYSAPSFDQIANHVARLLRERILVGHNLAFDARFLAAEFRRLNVDLPIEPSHGLCTMQLAARYLPSSGRSLSSCCLTAGITLTDPHSALADARATGQLFARYLADAGHPPPWAELDRYATADRWPESTDDQSVVVQLHRGESLTPAGGAWIGRLVARLPRVFDPPNADQYLAMLDMALLDRYLSLIEQDALLELAEELQLAPAEIRTLHSDYLTALAIEAWADGVVTADELNDLNQVATLLGLERTDVDGALLHAVAGAPRYQHARPVFQLQPGERVALTGDMELPREVWIERAQDAGLLVGGVTKKTRVLVAADPDSLSGKARKARDYGIPVINESAFAAILAKRQDARIGVDAS